MATPPGLSYDITSGSNPRIKHLQALADRSQRDTEGLFLVEGPRLFGRALSAGLEPVEVFVDGSVGSDWDGAVTVLPDVLDRASYRRRSEGLIAVFKQFKVALGDLELSPPALVLVTDSVEKPGNLGAVLRTADAVGADAVVETGSIDLFNPNLLRASTGACFTMPTVVCDFGALSDWLAGQGIRLVAADPTAPAAFWQTDLTGPVALLVGAEDRGLSPEALARADMRASIPMSGHVDSLNTSVAMALLAFEARRQRLGR